MLWKKNTMNYIKKHGLPIEDDEGGRRTDEEMKNVE